MLELYPLSWLELEPRVFLSEMTKLNDVLIGRVYDVGSNR